MIRIIANVSKKVPVPGVEYSSQSFMAGIEVEVSDGATPEEIQQKIHSVYSTLERTIDSEIAARNGEAPTTAALGSASEQRPANRLPTTKSGNGNGRRATQAQIKAILAIGQSIGMDRTKVIDYVAGEFGVKKLDDLAIKDASTLIERMKEEQAAKR